MVYLHRGLKSHIMTLMRQFFLSTKCQLLQFRLFCQKYLAKKAGCKIQANISLACHVLKI
jgi:hypothetical protein